MSNRDTLAPIILIPILLVLVAVLHLLGNIYSLYWKWEWYDVLLHTLGGIAIGAYVQYMGFYRLAAAAFALTLLIVWEVFEVYIRRIDTLSSAYRVDTVLDITTGLVGIIIGCYLVERFTRDTTL